MKRDFSQTIACYDGYLANKDNNARRAGWSSQADQELRFEHLLEALNVDTSSFSLLDVGCGPGGLFGYLARSGRDVDYVGVDVVPGMIEAAHELFPGGDFQLRDILADPPDRTFDVVFCCGALANRMDDHEAYTREMMARMAELADKVVVINTMSSRNFVTRSGLQYDHEVYYYDPVELYQFGREISPWVVLREDIRMTDATIYIYNKQYSRSIETYRNLKPPPSTAGIAWLYIAQKMPGSALKALESADIDTDAELLHLHALALQQQNRHGEARISIDKALALQSDYQPALRTLEILEIMGF